MSVKLSPEINTSNINHDRSHYVILGLMLVLSLIKTKRNPIFIYFYCCLLFFFIKNISLNIYHRDMDLNSCTKFEFFTIESINTSNNLTKYYLKNNFNLLTFFKLKHKKHPNFFQHLLLMSGDISLNPGPTQEFQLNNEMWSPFKKRGIHFVHININSILPKIEELRNIAKTSNVSVIGISETKLDE